MYGCEFLNYIKLYKLMKFLSIFFFLEKNDCINYKLIYHMYLMYIEKLSSLLKIIILNIFLHFNFKR